MDLTDEELEKTKAMKEKTADEMFGELGYIEKHYYKEVIVFYNPKNNENIQFDEFDKKFCKFSTDDDSKILDFNMQELKAIYKFFEEQDWLKE